jgi:hypothetical protein
MPIKKNKKKDLNFKEVITHWFACIYQSDQDDEVVWILNLLWNLNGNLTRKQTVELRKRAYVSSRFLAVPWRRSWNKI